MNVTIDLMDKRKTASETGAYGQELNAQRQELKRPGPPSQRQDFICHIPAIDSIVSQITQGPGNETAFFFLSSLAEKRRHSLEKPRVLEGVRRKQHHHSLIVIRMLGDGSGRG